MDRFYEKGAEVAVLDLGVPTTGTVVRVSRVSVDVKVGEAVWRFFERPLELACATLIGRGVTAELLTGGAG